MQQGGRGAAKPPMGIAFEGDLATRIDAALALTMLYGFVSKAEARAIAVCISRPSVKTAQFADVIAGVYTVRPVGGSAMIGMPETGPTVPDAAFLTTTLAKTTPEGVPAYTSNIAKLRDTADNAVLIRNMLLAQVDQNATIVVAGPLTGMVRLAELYGARPQIATKSKLLVIAAGAFPKGGAEASIKADVAAAKKVFADWPTPIVVVGAEVGDALKYPGASIDGGFPWAPSHPVVDAYRAFKTMPYDATASALAAVAYAAHPDDGLFKLSDPGTVTVTDDGRTEFNAAATGKTRYLIVDPEQQARVTKMYTDMVSATPPPRGGRGRGGGL